MKHVLLAAVVLMLVAAPARSAEPVDYLRDIKPILQAHCYDCHTGTSAEADLRLDTAKLAIDGGITGPAIVPGKSGQSVLFGRLTTDDTDQKMPPPEEGEPLSQEQIALVRAWIDQGAKAPEGELPTVDEAVRDHWSFQPVKAPPLPSVRQEDWVRTPIDRFILARLEQDNIKPSPEADRATLIRRVSLDLVGVPPTIVEVDGFLADKSEGAYERLVDRLLASPHYGERWGRHWLDQARYADSDGYTNDVPRSIWPYRDWVINALNRDMPFDQFTVDQIAGDLRPNATPDQIVATGFHRNTQHNREGGSDPEQYRVERVVDRVSTTGEVFLGLTVGCARCHEHKYDPISQREFYQLYAFFDSCDEPTYTVGQPDQLAKLDELKEQLSAATKQLAEYDAKITFAQAAWEKSLAAAQVEWTVLDPIAFQSAGGAEFEKQDDHSLLITGNIPNGDTYTVTTTVPTGTITAIRLEALTDDRLPSRGPGLTGHGNFVLYEFSATQSADDEKSKSSSIPLASAWADHSQDKFPVADAIDGDPKTGWAINVNKGQGSLNTNRTAIFTLKNPTVASDNTRLTFTLVQHHPGAHPYQIGRFRLSATSASPEVLHLQTAPEIAKILAIAPTKRTAKQKQLLTEQFRKDDPQRAKLAAAVDALKKREQALSKSLPTTLVMRERAQPRSTYVHVRGDFLAKGREVEPGVPAAFPPLASSDEKPTRVDFARWLVDPRNPLTPRVIMNRVWQAYFGRGIVETDNDLGTQGSKPTHPELLNYLASEFMARDWSLKAMHRLIVTSAVYRQSSRLRADLAQVDPRNQLLARQSRHRLEAEVIRDSALAVAGLLSPKLGGPGVYPPQPDGVMRLARNPNRKWVVSQGEDRYRRGLYTYFWRGTPYPFLKAFDAPDSNSSCTRRNRSNTPLQALMLLNDEAFFEAAQGLAARILAEASGDDQNRLEYAFRLVLARRPNDAELATLSELLTAERTDTEGGPKLLPTPALERMPVGVAPQEIVAWTAVARTLLNLDEFMTRE